MFGQVRRGEFFADGSLFTLPATIRVIERDIAFNDVGSKETKIKVNLTTSSPQRSTHVITVQELRGFLSKKKATFEVTMEAVVSDAILYVANEEGDGWVVTRPERGTENVSLPYHLKVILEKRDGNREYFTIREGILQSIKGSVQIELDSTSHLHAENPHTALIRLIYSLSRKTVRFGRKVYKVLPYPNDPEPLRQGLYDIEIPDVPHEGGESYLDRARLAKVWFRIGHSGARYLHAGSATLGCVTLTEIERWDDLCKVLMKARKGDGKSIGVLEIVD